jgi:serine phosphatase RsbU (regulator of sigma subunit)
LIETHAAEAADPGRFLTELNNEFTRIMKQTGTLVFATVLYCVINIRERGARFARAGHPAPLRVRRTAGEIQTVASGEGSGGPAMGLIPNAQFKTTEAKLAPGDLLLFFTDGVGGLAHRGFGIRRYLFRFSQFDLRTTFGLGLQCLWLTRFARCNHSGDYLQRA